MTLQTRHTTSSEATVKSDGSIADVAIIGGGVAGCYAAYRLSSDDAASSRIDVMLERGGRDRLDIRLYECSDRIGGRLWTYPVPGTSETVELGGMGFSLLHQFVWGLSNHLGLEMEAFHPYMKAQLQYLRGHRFMNDQFENGSGAAGKGDVPPAIPPYFLYDTAEQRLEPYQLIMLAFERGLPSTSTQPSVSEQIMAIVGTVAQLPSQPTPEQLEPVFTAITDLIVSLRDRHYTHADFSAPIHEVGFWSFLEDQLGLEAYNLATDSSFAGSFNENWNLYDSIVGFAATLFCMVLPDDDGSYAKFVHLVDGYQSLPLELARRFAAAGGTIAMRTRLASIDVVEIGGERIFELDLVAESPHGATAAGATAAGPPEPNRRTIQRARSVILAMPRRAIELIEFGPSIQAHVSFAQFSDAVESVTPTPAGKLWMLFDNAWWTTMSPPMSKGYSNTDLPLRAVYYIDDAIDGQRGHARLLTSLSDGRFTQYWDGYLRARHIDPFGGRLGDRVDDVVGDTVAAPRHMVIDAREQLEKMHGCSVPHPAYALYKHWNDGTYGGGWHNWNPHVKSWEVERRMQRPLVGLDLFVCGEAWSSRQGWVEGALITAEAVLERGYGLPRPSWINRRYEPAPGESTVTAEAQSA